MKGGQARPERAAPRFRAILGVSVAAAALLCAKQSRAAYTDLYFDWALPAEPGWYWADYLDYVNRGNSNTIGNTGLLEYQTKTGLTGTSRDSFEFWAGFDLGYSNPAGSKSNNSGWGVAIPNIGAEWYYFIMPSDLKQGDPNYRVLSFSPWVEINAPNGNTNSTGFGAGLNQWSFQGALLFTYRSGRFTTTIQPIMLTYAASDVNRSTVIDSSGTPVLSRVRGGLSATLGAANVGYDVTPTLTLGLYQAWNAYSISGANYAPKQYEGTIGPMVTWSGLSEKYGLTISATVQADYYRSSGMPEGVFVSAYFVKHF